MSILNVERLTLQVSGVSERDARRLALLVSECLAHSSLPPVASGEIGAMQLRVAPPPDGNLSELAEQIAAELIQQLAQRA